MTEIRKKGDPELGAKLRKIREDADLSQEELARRLGIKRAQISRVESGTRGTGAVIELVAAWSRLSERQRGRILGIIEADEA